MTDFLPISAESVGRSDLNRSDSNRVNTAREAGRDVEGLIARSNAPSPRAGRIESDRAEFSDQARAMAALQEQEGEPVRTELVNEVRAQIAAGTYETDEKFDLAVDALLSEVVERI